MIPTAGIPAQRPARMDDYLRRIERHLETNGISGAARNEILTELKSHLTDRIAEFQAGGSHDPLGQALAVLGDPIEIASEFAATARLRAASRSYFPPRLLSAAWSLTRTFGHGLYLFAIGVAGYALSLGGLVAALIKFVLPDKVGLWVGDHGVVWGMPPEGALARELVGNWFIPLSAWFAIVVAAGTTLLLRKHIQSFVAARKLRQP